MVSFSTLALFSLAAVGSLAGPLEKRKGLWKHDSKCMSDAEAQQVADNYGELIRNYSDDLVDEALTKDFIDYSEGVNSLINTCPQGAAAKPLPLLSPSFSSRAQFKEGQGQQDPIHFTQLGIWHSCDSVTIRWTTDNTAPIPNPRPVVGLIVMNTEKASSGKWKIKKVFSEFDSGAWLQNLEEWGICTVSESGSPTVAISGSPSGVAQTNSASNPLDAPASASAAASASASYAGASSTGANQSPSYALKSSSGAASAASSAAVSSAAPFWAASTQAPSASSYAASSYTA